MTKKKSSHEPSREELLVEISQLKSRLAELEQLEERHRQAEIALQQANERLQALIQASPLSITLLDKDGRVKMWNIAAERIFGWRVDEVLGQRLPIVPDERWGEFLLLRDRLLQGVVINNMEITRLRKDGSQIHINLSAAPVRDVNGNVTTIMAVIADISERKQALEALKRERDFNSAVMDTAGALIVVLDAQSRIVLFNRACEEITGYSFAEVKDRYFWDIFLIPEEMAAVKKIIRSVSNGNFPNKNKNHWRTKSGQLRMIAWSNSAIIKEDGSVVYIISTGIDITEQQQAEIRIEEQAALLDVAHDAIFVCDMQDHVLYWNKSAERLYGWTQAEALAGKADELMSQDNNQQLQEAKDVLLNYGEWTGELKQTTRYGKDVIVESRWTLVRDKAGKEKSVLVVNTNITEKKRIEAQFLRAQRMESIGTLASGIAHDLNNVLAPILMAIKVLKHKLPEEQEQHLLDGLQRNTMRGADLVKQVLAFARGIGGERKFLQARHIIFDIEKIIRETFPRSIQLSVNVEKELWPVNGDATQLHQVLMNLCVNARDAMPSGGKLTVTAQNLSIDEINTGRLMEMRSGNYVLIIVSDTGYGISPEYLDRIFEPFFTTKELGHGTGLGLSTASGIVKSHNGFIHVHSDVEKGSIFRVYLPAARSVEMPKMIELTSEQPKHSNATVLVVEDEAIIREVTKESLEDSGYRVLLAGDGAEALKLFQNYQAEIDVVITDMMMPVMDGPTTIFELRKLDPAVKVIAVSGIPSEDRIAEAARIGAKAFLAKPYTSEEFFRVLEDVLKN